MMKADVLVVMVGVLLGCTATAVVEGTATWGKARSETVLVEDLIGSLGTGVVINSKCVVTAGHVADTDAAQVTTASGKVYPVHKVAHDEKEDVAALCSTSDLDAPPTTFGPPPATYDPVFTIGFPIGYPYYLTEGRWQEKEMMSAPCAPGNSGGGVFDSSSRYVGFVDSIVVYRPGGANIALPHMCHVIPATAVSAFLGDNHIEYHHE